MGCSWPSTSPSGHLSSPLSYADFRDIEWLSSVRVFGFVEGGREVAGVPVREPVEDRILRSVKAQIGAGG